MKSYGVYQIACLFSVMVAANLGIEAQACTDTSTMNSAGYELTLASRSLAQQVDPTIVRPQAVKFVQIEVTDVINPNKTSLTFTVHYRPIQGDQLLLGMFSLFPPDNPGKFIIATQGKLQAGGTLLVSFAPLEESKDPSAIRVHIERISFIRE